MSEQQESVWERIAQQTQKYGATVEEEDEDEAFKIIARYALKSSYSARR